jgi:hypothetical protein
MKKGDTLIYIGESDDSLENGQEVNLMEDLSDEAIAGMNNTPELIKVSCLFLNKNKNPEFRLLTLSDLKTKL